MARSLDRLSIAELNAELRRRQRSTGTLQLRYERTMAKAARLRAQIEELGGSVGGTGGGKTRPKNEMTLVEALEAALKGKTMNVTDVAEAVQKQGYRTSSNNFRTQVNIALIKSGKFKRVGRGEYTAK